MHHTRGANKRHYDHPPPKADALPLIGGPEARSFRQMSGLGCAVHAGRAACKRAVPSWTRQSGPHYPPICRSTKGKRNTTEGYVRANVNNALPYMQLFNYIISLVCAWLRNAESSAPISRWTDPINDGTHQFQTDLELFLRFALSCVHPCATVPGPMDWIDLI